MTSPSYGAFGQQGQYTNQQIPMSQGMGMGQHGYAGSGFPQSQNTYQTTPGFTGMGMGQQGYGAPGFPQGQGVPQMGSAGMLMTQQNFGAPDFYGQVANPQAPAGAPMGQQTGGGQIRDQGDAGWKQLVDRNPGMQGSVWSGQAGRGGGTIGSHPARGGLSNTNQGARDAPPEQLMQNMSLDAQEKKDEEARKPPAGAPTGPRGGNGQQTGQVQRGGSHMNQTSRGGNDSRQQRAPILGLHEGRPFFSVDATSGAMGYRRNLYPLYVSDKVGGADAVSKTFCKDSIRFSWWNSKADPKEGSSKFYIFVEPKKKEGVEDFETVRELMRAHNVLMGWVRQVGGTVLNAPTKTLVEYFGNGISNGNIKYPSDVEVHDRMTEFLVYKEEALKAAREKISRDRQMAEEMAEKERVKQQKEEEAARNKVALDPATVSVIIMSNPIVDWSAEEVDDEHLFGVEKYRKEWVSLWEYERRLVNRGKKEAKREAKALEKGQKGKDSALSAVADMLKSDEKESDEESPDNKKEKKSEKKKRKKSEEEEPGASAAAGEPSG